MSTPDPSAVPDPVWDWEGGVDQGYLGFEVDPTPDENYSVVGGPTPETDPAARLAAKQRRDALFARLGGADLSTPKTKSTRSTSASSGS